jgi:hypothetical protein
MARIAPCLLQTWVQKIQYAAQFDRMIVAEKNTLQVTCVSTPFINNIAFVVSGPCCLFGILFPSEFPLLYHDYCIPRNWMHLRIHVLIDDVATVANVLTYM